MNKQFVKNPIVAKYLAEKYPNLGISATEEETQVGNPSSVAPSAPVSEPVKPSFEVPEVDMTQDKEDLGEAYRNAMLLEGAQQVGAAIAGMQHQPGRMTEMLVGQAREKNKLSQQERDLKRQGFKDKVDIADRDRRVGREDEQDERARIEFGQKKKQFDRDDQLFSESEDPDSPLNKKFQEQMLKFGPEFAGMTYADYQRYGGNLLKLKQDAAEITARNEERRLRRQELNQQREESNKRWEAEHNLRKDQFEFQKQKKEAESAKGGEGQKAVDKDYAKAYNDYTQKGRVNAVKGIEKLEKLAQQMESGQFGSGPSRFGPAIGDKMGEGFRDQDTVRIMKEVRNSANATLKDLFGGQLSDGERKAASEEYFIDGQDFATNSKIVRQKIQQLKEALKAEDQKALYYEQNGYSLKDFAGVGDQKREVSQEKAPNEVKRKTKDGKIAVFNKETKEFIRYEE